ncbi:hypothetical protein LPJ57_003360 [Coemansia sp. RSA 486]|nr:hypothetical protein LPJ57_003360 [Coemansia sp. RSA 486]
MVSISAYHTPGVNGRKALGKATPLANSFSLIEYNEYFRFLIMDCPTNSTIPLYLKEFARLNVTDVVRVCEPTYDKERLDAHNVSVHDLPFKDGDVPPQAVIKSWLELVNERIVSAKQKQNEQPAPTTIAVHCVAGLGLALIEKGTDPLDAIEHVRRKRRGAFNNRQITYLADNYKRSSGSKGAAKLGSAIRQSPLTSGTSPLPTSPSDNDPVSPQTQTAATASGNSKPNSTSSTVSASRALFKKIFGSH